MLIRIQYLALPYHNMASPAFEEMLLPSGVKWPDASVDGRFYRQLARAKEIYRQISHRWRDDDKRAFIDACKQLREPTYCIHQFLQAELDQVKCSFTIGYIFRTSRMPESIYSTNLPYRFMKKFKWDPTIDGGPPEQLLLPAVSGVAPMSSRMKRPAPPESRQNKAARTSRPQPLTTASPAANIGGAPAAGIEDGRNTIENPREDQTQPCSGTAAISSDGASSIEDQINQLQTQLRKQDMTRIGRLERALEKADDEAKEARAKICAQTHQEADLEIRKLREDIRQLKTDSQQVKDQFKQLQDAMEPFLVLLRGRPDGAA
jgi:hypothetical protein